MPYFTRSPFVRLFLLLLVGLPMVAAAQGSIIATYDPTAPPPVTVAFSLDTNPTVRTQLLWSFGDGARGLGTSPVHTYDQAGTYTVVLQYSDAGGPRQLETTIDIFGNLIIEDDFDDQAFTELTWNLDSSDEWNTHFLDDGSGGYALLFSGNNDWGSGQDGAPNSGASFPPPLQSGGGGRNELLLDEAHFGFHMALDALDIDSYVFEIFALENSDLSMELNLVASIWYYRLVGPTSSTAWVALPANTNAYRVEIHFETGSAPGLGRFEVLLAGNGPAGFGWTHTSSLDGDFQIGSGFFLGMRSEGPVDSPIESNLNGDLDYAYAVAFDRFGAYNYQLP